MKLSVKEGDVGSIIVCDTEAPTVTPFISIRIVNKIQSQELTFVGVNTNVKDSFH